MYLFVHYICFYSNKFGFDKKKIVPFDDVTSVRKAKTTAIFPNAIEISTGEKKHFFASFLSRDEAFQLIVEGWELHHSNSVEARIYREDSKVELRSQEDGHIVFKRLKTVSQPSNDVASVDRNRGVHHPIKIYFGEKSGRCQEVQKFRVYRSSHLFIETSQEVSEVPYGDYFHVEGLWDVENDGDEINKSCILRVYTNVVFSKKTMWKGKIEQSAVEECREAYAHWLNHAHELLKQRSLMELDGLADIIQNDEEV
ncbi:hypothetical protein GIB67_001709 [Kingdonia uniflora]|uniref:VASt domain-containing protein n=1 Tax=Kingdonia uniflora TaxID=39325 RepID=A0A7J7LMM1_9MAGN|nr:hypothetical protein GIB67_001709 [Kingdonia uniflora]